MALKLGELVAILRGDDKHLRATMDRAKAKMDETGARAGVLSGALAKMLAPAVLGPALPATVAGVAGLGAALAGAGAAAGVFGAVFKTAFGEIKEASDKSKDLRDKIALLNEQIRVANETGIGDAGKLEEQKVKATNELLARYRQLPPATRDVVKSYDDMKMSWQGFVDQNKPATYAIMTGGFKTIAKIIPQLQPLFDIIVGRVQLLVNWLGKTTDGGGIKKFVGWLTAQAGPTMDHLAGIVKNLATVFGALFYSTAPSGQGLLATLDALTAKAAVFAQGGGFERLMTSVTANGPSAFATLRDIAVAAVHIAQAVAPLAPITVAVAAALAQLLAALPPGVIQTLVGAWLAYTVAVKAHAAVMLVLQARTVAVAIATKGAAAAQAIWKAVLLASNFAAATAQIATYLIKVAAVRVATLATAAAQGIWNAAMVAGNFAAATAQLAGFLIKQGAIALATKAWAAAQWLLNVAMSANPVGLVIIAIVALIAIFVLLWTKCSWFRDFWIGAWNLIKTAASAAWQWIKSTATSFWSWISALPGKISSAFTSGWNKVKTGAATAWDWVKNKVTTFYNWVISLPGKVSSKLSSMWNGLWTGFKTIANRIIRGWNNLSFTIGGGSFAGVSIPSVTLGTPNIPYLAKGGIVPATPGGRLIGVGEGGEDEAVIPLSKLQDLLGRIVLELRSSGAAVDDMLLEILRSAIKSRGGNVQVVIGTGKG